MTVPLEAASQMIQPQNRVHSASASRFSTHATPLSQNGMFSPRFIFAVGYLVQDHFDYIK